MCEPYWEIETLYRDVLFASTKSTSGGKEEAREVIEMIANEELAITKIAEKVARRVLLGSSAITSPTDREP